MATGPGPCRYSSEGIHQLGGKDHGRGPAVWSGSVHLEAAGRPDGGRPGPRLPGRPAPAPGRRGPVIDRPGHRERLRAAFDSITRPPPPTLAARIRAGVMGSRVPSLPAPAPLAEPGPPAPSV